jgi:hypothetical protein
MAEPFLTGVSPSRAIEGGRVTLVGEFGDSGVFPEVRIHGRPARAVFASPKRLTVIIPSGISDGGFSSISLGEATSEQGLELGVPIATGLHQVDNPLIDQAGNVYSPTAARVDSRCRFRSSAWRPAARGRPTPPRS